jgi:predicted nuclease with RNAse H fold
MYPQKFTAGSTVRIAERHALLRVVRLLPSNLAGFGMLSHEGQESDNP